MHEFDYSFILSYATYNTQDRNFLSIKYIWTCYCVGVGKYFPQNKLPKRIINLPEENKKMKLLGMRFL